MIRFILANTLFPIAVSLTLQGANFPIPVTFWVSICSAALLFAANIFFFITQSHHRIVIGVVAILNILALILLSEIGVVTGLPVAAGLFR